LRRKGRHRGVYLKKLKIWRKKYFQKWGGMIFLEIYILGDWGDILTEKLIRSFFHCKKVEN